MSPSPPDASPVKRSAFRRWLKRIFVAFAILLLVAVVFHRPLLRWGVNTAALHFAAKAGYALTWDFGGTVVSGIKVGGLKVTGPDAGALRSASWDDAQVDYSLWNFWRRGLGELVQNVSLKNATVEMDVRTRPDAPPKVPKEKKPGPPPDIWVGRIDLQNITANITTDGGVIVLKGLTLLLDPAAPGTLEIAELIVPAAKLHLNNVTAATKVVGRELQFTNLKLMPDLTIPELKLDAAALKNGEAGVVLAILSGPGKLRLEGAVTGIGTALELDATLEASDLPHTEIARWAKLPENMAWKVDRLVLQAKGNPAQPQNLAATLSLAGSDIQVAGLPPATVNLQADLKSGGALALKSLEATMPGTVVRTAGDVTLPASWGAMAQVRTRQQWSLDVADLSVFSRPNLALAGQANGSGTLEYDAGTISQLTSTWNVTALKAGQANVESLKAEITGAGKEVQLRSLNVQIDGQNKLSLTGDVSLDGQMPASATFDLALEDLALLSQSLGLPEAQRINAGTLSGKGNAKLVIKDVTGGNLQTMTASAALTAGALDWQGRKLQSLELNAGVEQGTAKITQLKALLDDRNRLEVTGSMGLSGEQPLEAAWDIDLPDLASLIAWAGLNHLPPPESGLLISSGKASGSLASLKSKDFTQVQAVAKVELRDLVWEKNRFDRLTLDSEMKGGEAVVKELKVLLNDANQLQATGTVKLNEALDFQADLNGAMNRLQDLNGWLLLSTRLKPPPPPRPEEGLLLPLPTDGPGEFPGPLANPEAKPPVQFTSGKLALNWKGSGSLKTVDIHGGGQVKLDALKLEGRPDAYSLDLETTHEGRKAEITRLTATAGALRAEIKAAISETLLDVSQLKLSSGDLALVEGRAAVPLVLNQSPRPAIPIPPDQPIEIDLNADKLDLGRLFRSLGQKAPPVQGVATLKLETRGTLSNLSAKLGLAVTDIRAAALAGKLTPASLRLDMTLAENKLLLDSQVTQSPLQPLTLKVDAPLDLNKLRENPQSALDTPLKASVRLPASDLNIVRKFAPIVASIQGTTSIDLDIDGTAKEPHWKGQIMADVSAAELGGMDMAIRDARLRISFQDRKISLDDLSATAAGGSLRVQGTADLANLADPALDFRLQAKEALVIRDEALSQRADADISCKGTLSKSHVEGQVSLVRGRVFKEVEFIPLSLPNSLPPPPPPVRRSNAKPAAPPPFDKWTFNLAVNTKDPIRLLGNVLNGGVVVDMKAQGTGAAPEIEGKVSLRDARLQLPFSRVTITKGEVLFTKDKPLDPQLDLVGDSLVNGIQVTLYAYGSALAPKTRFTSSPPMSEGDIATLLATGTTASDLGSSEGMAANRAAFLLISQTYRKVFKKGVRRRYEEEPPKLSFSFNPLSTGNSQRGVTGTYEFSPKVQFTGTVSENGGFRGLLYYMIRFR